MPIDSAAIVSTPTVNGSFVEPEAPAAAKSLVDVASSLDEAVLVEVDAVGAPVRCFAAGLKERAERI